MSTGTLEFERTYNAPISKTWAAITDKGQMKEWYFNLDEFKPEVGFKFSFLGGPPDGEQFLHVCEILEVIPGKKLSHSWRYDGFEGNSTLTWELFDEGDKTRLKLTHTGLDTFPADRPEFVISNFNEGWTHILGIGLKDYLEK
ncbi:SRPBCC domain-containing protein [Mucilaginibacter sp. HMF5004]|uniref:SRPBCC family protein n=1 Tax=Mucilaginibacter rivuli TaxID=2857527 RepID=UPI001C5CD9F8|nr:SRPBCC domain-containing protein [Mucilaginibacter rivuli]MBW4891929.1 SRPBCC domain-containing protein [Mucilaginibacter rivuli]